MACGVQKLRKAFQAPKPKLYQTPEPLKAFDDLKPTPVSLKPPNPKPLCWVYRYKQAFGNPPVLQQKPQHQNSCKLTFEIL